MLFKKLRSRSKSTSKSTKPSISRMLSTSSSRENKLGSKTVDVTVSPAPMANLNLTGQAGTNDEAKDYEKFLEKARKDAERAEKRKLKEIKAAKEVNMSPWASRM
jgi:ATP-dependent protease HslVU (ClpYQ) ATPase subunit